MNDTPTHATGRRRGRARLLAVGAAALLAAVTVGLATPANAATQICSKPADPGADPATNLTSQYSGELERAKIFGDLVHMAFDEGTGIHKIITNPAKYDLVDPPATRL